MCTSDDETVTGSSFFGKSTKYGATQTFHSSSEPGSPSALRGRSAV